jgi:protein-disulfide isomerase
MPTLRTLRRSLCPHCLYACFESRNLALHVTVVNNKVRDRMCPHCNKAFAQLPQLKIHIKAVHQINKIMKFPHYIL